MEAKELPEGWEWKRLGEVATINSGNGAPQGDEYFIDGNYPFVRTFDVGKEKANKNLVNVRDYINDRAIKEHGMRLFPEKTLLIPKSGASTFLNHRALLGIPAYVSSHLATVNANKNLIPEYLFYWSQLVDARTLTHDINYPSLKLSEIESALISLPPLSVQRRIVAILEQAEALKRRRQQADELAQRFLHSVFNEMFGDPVRNEKGWEVKKLIDIVENGREITYGIVQPGQDIISGIPIVRPIDLTENYVTLSGLKKVDPNIESAYPRSRLKGGEILLSIRGSLNYVSIASKELLNGNINRDIAIIAPNSSCFAEYLLFLFKDRKMQQKILNLSKGITLIGYNLADLRKFLIPIPPFPLQQHFALVVEQVEALREQQQASGQEIAMLFDGLMENAFRGELIAN